MPHKNYSVVSIPKSVMKKVKQLLDEEQVTGYRNPTEFVLDCIRRRIEQIERNQGSDLDHIEHIITKVFEEYKNKKEN